MSVSGNLYSVPDTTRRRVLDVHVFADEIRIFARDARGSPFSLLLIKYLLSSPQRTAGQHAHYRPFVCAWGRQAFAEDGVLIATHAPLEGRDQRCDVSGQGKGTLISKRPPHRSERARLRHSAPTLGV